MTSIEGLATVTVHDQDGVRAITLNRPEQLNAIDMTMIEALEAAIRAAHDDRGVSVLLLRGAGRAFCAGDDINAQAAICEAGEASLRAQLTRLQSISELLTLGEKLCVAEVRGWAIGAGFSWALNCDFRAWGVQARAFFPEVSFGAFVTGGASCLLPRLAGSQAAELLFLGTKLNAARASVLGLAHSVHAEDELAEAALTLAQVLAALHQPAARLMKRTLAAGFAQQFRDALHQEIEACVATTLDPRTLERMRAAIAGTSS